MYKFFGLFFGSSSNSRKSFNQSTRRKEPNINKNQNRRSRDGKSFQGGEYVDYEEVD
ncbi:MAG: hypothetical protein AAFQ94_02285 [Bacteroidota bacterium]